MDTGNLSGFIGAWCPQFYGGDQVQQLERNWESFFSVKYAVSMNSATSCLYAAIAAIGIEPGDEVIVTPTTMTATITGIVLYQAIPVFADISPDTLCICPEEIKKKITSKTAEQAWCRRAVPKPLTALRGSRRKCCGLCFAYFRRRSTTVLAGAADHAMLTDAFTTTGLAVAA